MSLTFNMVGGGGGGLKATDALLRVQAPAGSTVTISKGTTTKTDLGHENADDHSVYDYYFIIHQSQFDSVNPWTVTATLGGDSISDTVIIDAADEYDMQLTPTMYLVRNGVIQGDALITLGMKSSSASNLALIAPTVTYDGNYVTIGYSATSSGQGGIAYFPKKINLSNYRTLRVIGQSRNNTGSGYTNNSSVNAWTDFGTYQVDNRTFKQDTQSSSTSSSYVTMNLSIDISSLGGTQYIGFNSTSNNSGYTSVRITDMYLEQ